MAQYNNRKTHIVFTSEESEPDVCPVCQAELDFAGRVCDEDEVTDTWVCPECKASGVMKSRIGFVGHLVRKESIPEDFRDRYIPIQTECLNGLIRKGSIVLPVTENPCLVGKVTGFGLCSPEGACDVYVDCTYDYSGDRMTDLENRCLYLNGRYIPCDEMGLSDRVFPANGLLCLEHLSEAELWQVRSNEEEALRCACRIMAELLKQEKAEPDDE